MNKWFDNKKKTFLYSGFCQNVHNCFQNLFHNDSECFFLMLEASYIFLVTKTIFQATIFLNWQTCSLWWLVAGVGMGGINNLIVSVSLLCHPRMWYRFRRSSISIDEPPTKSSRRTHPRVMHITAPVKEEQEVIVESGPVVYDQQQQEGVFFHYSVFSNKVQSTATASYLLLSVFVHPGGYGYCILLCTLRLTTIILLFHVHLVFLLFFSKPKSRIMPGFRQLLKLTEIDLQVYFQGS